MVRHRLLFLALLFLVSCGHEEKRTADGRIILNYWEKWTNFEADAMQEIVDEYNQSQDRVYVNFVSQSDLERKMLLGISSGKPPDVAGLWSQLLASYVDMGALIPLDRYMKRDGITRDGYIPKIIEMCEFRGHTWALPSTPASVGLHYNKRLFREAGLDPDKPPQTIDELNAMAKQLTRQRPNGSYECLGFLPVDPNWWLYIWSIWFNDKLVSDDGRELVCDSPETVAALEWFRSYTQDYDYEQMRLLEAAHRGQFASSANAFMSERVAMMLQGVWMANFIEQFHPGMDWGAAPFPASFDTEGEPVTFLEGDILAIPRGAAHPDEAWDFIRFVERQDNMEKLCRKHLKFTPLTKVSEDFYKDHPNPYVKVFRRMAESKNARYAPKIPVWTEYRDELRFAYDRVWSTPNDVDPVALLKGVKERVQPRLDEANRRWERVREEREKEWAEE